MDVLFLLFSNREENQILADVAGVPISLTTVSDAVSIGSAICAAVGAGVFTDLRAAGQAMVRLGIKIEPDASQRAIYDEGYARYKDTYSALAPLFQRTHS